MNFWKEYEQLSEQAAKTELELDSHKERLSTFLRRYAEEKTTNIEREGVPYKIMCRGTTYFLRKVAKR